MRPEFDDQSARDAAVRDLDDTLFMEAGAGTGKTTLLVGRVVGLVTSGRARMEQIAAITFTEAAAAELRDQLREKFERLATDGANEEARAAVAALDAAAVTTLHGFARRILAEQPFAAGLPPLFEVTDRSSALVAFDERWQVLVDSWLEEPEYEELMMRALSCGVDVKALRAAALRCEENWDRLDPAPLAGPPPALDATLLRRLLGEAMAHSSECTEPNDRLLDFLAGDIWRGHDALGHAVDEVDLLQILIGLKKLEGGNKGQLGNWRRTSTGTSYKEEVLTLLRAAEAERHRLVDQTVQWVLSSLFGHIVSFTLGAAAARRAAGRLTFLDLLEWARWLVSTNPEARGELHRRYRYILIDEFQDTDPIQAQLAMCLATDWVGEHIDSWSDLPIPPGRLFFVGDPKQSIYRFRRADIELFMEVREHVVTAPKQLTTNFRSRPQIVAWLNAVFNALIGAGEDGKQPAYIPLSPSGDLGTDNPRGLAPVIVLGQDATDGSADQVRERQAREVVAAIATMHAEEWKVGRSGTPLSYSDVAVLIRARTGLPILERAFAAAGVPCRLESSSLVYESQEVEQLLSVLRAIDDPTDSLSVLAALRSPAFGCGDDDLLRHRVAGGSWDPRSAGADGTPVADALAALRAYQETSWWESVSALVSRIVADRHLMTLALTESRARESWRRIRFVMDQARLFDEVNGGDLRAFLRWVGHQRDEGANVTEAILPESDDDAVRITTIHSAKGLEYPVVFLLGLQAVPRSRKNPLLFTSHGAELHLTGGFETAGYDAAYEDEQVMDAYEQRRLLYVAATRARDILVVSAHRGENASASLAAQVIEQCESCTELWSDGSELCTTTSGAAVGIPAQIPDPPTDDEGSRMKFADRRARLLARESFPTTIAATGVRTLAQQRTSPAPVDVAGMAEVAPLEYSGDTSVHRRGRAGTAVGRAVHGVLQVIDLASGDDLESLAHAQAVAEGIADRTSEVRDCVRAALESDLVRQAVQDGRYWRELYVGVPVGDRVLEGFIDLLFETPEGLAIVDYKTDHIDAEDGAATVADRYRLQGAAYALGTRLALDRLVVSCTFLILSPNRAIAAPLIDLESAISEVEGLLTQPVH